MVGSGIYHCSVLRSLSAGGSVSFLLAGIGLELSHGLSLSGKENKQEKEKRHGTKRRHETQHCFAIVSKSNLEP